MFIVLSLWMREGGKTQEGQVKVKIRGNKQKGGGREPDELAERKGKKKQW